MTTNNLTNVHHHGRSDVIVIDYIGKLGLGTLNENPPRDMATGLKVNSLQALFQLPMPCTEFAKMLTRINAVKIERANMEHGIADVLNCNFCPIAEKVSERMDRQVEVIIRIGNVACPATLFSLEHFIPGLFRAKDAGRRRYIDGSENRSNHHRTGHQASQEGKARHHGNENPDDNDPLPLAHKAMITQVAKLSTGQVY